ncbi:HemK/PrmC family methyltransferase [Helicobacter mesocricetorum]|uniref:HemK/PrmC family methyltransferase n=1 Tax=Helicobacter mesocricetorum TaxID=87012 RepID=UPI000CF1A007|nr:HemK/PrmC family methyltransferase [Helicobacter mesocricetorum]
MTIQEAIIFGTKKLHFLERPTLESEILLAFVLKKPRIYLHSHSFKNINPFEEEHFKRLILRRENFEPIEYITEKVSFYGQEFYISNGALIPRPETEILVDVASHIIQSKNCQSIAEIGVGSGIISITLALLHQNKSLEFHASDISPEALFNAYVNIQKFNRSNIALYNSPFLDFNTHQHFDLLLSNPPYIKNKTTLPKPLSFEPPQALFGGDRGDEILHKIILIAKERNIPYVVCEMGYDQKNSIMAFTKNLALKKLEFYQDLSGLDRGFIIEF